MKLYRYWKPSFLYLRSNTESILDHQQRVHTLRTFICYHAISTGSFLCQVNFPMCNGLQSQHWVKWPWTWSSGAGLCTNTLNMSLWFLPSDVCFSLICLKTTESFSDGFLVEKPFPCIVEENKCELYDSMILWNTFSLAPDTENSSNSHSNLAINHLGWSQKCPVGGIELNFPHFLQTAEQNTASFLSQRAQPAPDSQLSVHLQQTLTVFCIQENQLSGS